RDAERVAPPDEGDEEGPQRSSTDVAGHALDETRARRELPARDAFREAELEERPGGHRPKDRESKLLARETGAREIAHPDPGRGEKIPGRDAREEAFAVRVGHFRDLFRETSPRADRSRTCGRMGAPLHARG